MMSRPFSERRRFGTQAQNEDYKRLRQELGDRLHLSNNHHRKTADYAATYRNGEKEPIEAKCWPNSVLTHRNYLSEVKPKFHEQKGGVVYFIEGPKGITPAALRDIKRDQRTLILGHSSLRNYLYNQSLGKAGQQRDIINRTRRRGRVSCIPPWHISRYGGIMREYTPTGIGVNRPQISNVIRYPWYTHPIGEAPRIVRYLEKKGYGGKDVTQVYGNSSEYNSGAQPVAPDVERACELPPPFVEYGAPTVPQCHIGLMSNEPCDTSFTEPTVDFLVAEGGNYCYTHRCRRVWHKGKGTYHWFKIRPKPKPPDGHIPLGEIRLAPEDPLNFPYHLKHKLPYQLVFQNNVATGPKEKRNTLKGKQRNQGRVCV